MHIGAVAFDIAPRAKPVVSEPMEAWLKRTVLESTPEAFGYDTPLWTCALLAEVLSQHWSVQVSANVRLSHQSDGTVSERPVRQQQRPP